MKIGLLTTYSFNYGSYHQAVALQRLLHDMGHDCELINENFKRFQWPSLLLLYYFSPLVPWFLKKKIGRRLQQYNTYLKIKNDISSSSISPAGSTDMHKISRRYDCMIVGSDELWSADTGSIRFFPEHFGYNIDCPHFAYATCAVNLDLGIRELREKVKMGLETFTSLSVRDLKSKFIIKDIMDCDIPRVLDPTLLNPFFVSTGNKGGGGYVLLYGEHYDAEQKDYILHLAQKRSWKTACVGWSHSWCDVFYNVDTAEELQRMFAGAEFCFPSTFHGTIFSLLHQRQFVAMLNFRRGEKVRLLLEEFDLKDTIFKRGHKAITIDYGEFNKKLEMSRRQSMNYLNQAIKRVQKQEE